MASRKNYKGLSAVLAMTWLVAAASAHESLASCLPGPALVKSMLESDQPFYQDENRGVWERAADCEWRAIADQAGDRAISQFEVAALDNGLAGGLRTFARNGDFRLYLEGRTSMPLGASNSYLNHQPLTGAWRDSARGQSADSTLLFAVGEVLLTKGGRYQYAQVWQFDSQVANWGVKLLLLRPVAKK